MKKMNLFLTAGWFFVTVTFLLTAYGAPGSKIRKAAQIQRKTADSLYASALDNDGTNRAFAISEARKSLEIAERSNYPEGMQAALLYLAEVHAIENRDPAAIGYFKKLFDLSLVLKDSMNMAYALNSIGKLYYKKGALSRALKFFLDAFDIAEKTKNAYLLSANATSLGDIYYRVGQYGKAKEYFRIAYQEQQKIHNRDGLAKASLKLGKSYLNVGNISKGIFYFRKALKLHTETENPKGIAEADIELAKGYSRQKKYEKALRYAKNALQEAEKLDAPDLRALVYSVLGDIYFHSGDVNTALRYSEEALKFVQNVEIKNNIYKLLLDIYSFLDVDYEVLKYYKLYNRNRKEIMLPEMLTSISALQEQFDKEKEKRLLDIQLKNEEITRLRRRNVIWTGIFLLALIIFLSVLYIGKLKYTQKLHLLATTDSLTGLANRRKMEEKLSESVIRYRRDQTAFSILMGDIDHFKKINDTYGHDFGDYVLKTVSNIMLEHTRGQDTVSRWGGEEFLILAPDTDLKGAVFLGEKIRAAVAGTHFSFHGKNASVTLTFGVCQYTPEATVEECIKRADNALYLGKSQGRNRVVAGKPQQTETNPDNS